MTRPPLRLMIVSNGYGEDLIGAKLGGAFRTLDSSIEILPFPLIGTGAAYQAKNFSPKTISPVPKSGGFIRTAGDLIKDLRGGIISTLWDQRRSIQHQSTSIDAIVAVGDVFCLMWATAGQRRPTIFLPTAKSDLFMPHSALEYCLIRRRADWIFTRDTVTAEGFGRKGIDAQFLGNPMMDGLVETPPLDRPIDTATLALLPGSRAECYGNFKLILLVLSHMPAARPFFGWICMSPQVDREPIYQILQAHGYTHSNGHWTDPNGMITLVLTPHFAAAVHASDAVIGLAGTANEQAAWLGKSVIAFPGTGAQSRPQRFLEQRRLIGPQLRFVNSSDPKDIVNTVIHSLSLPQLPPPSTQNAAVAIARHAMPLILCSEIS